jgi:hypothetical protein
MVSAVDRMLFSTGARTWTARYYAANGDILDFSDMSRFIPQARHGFGVPAPQEVATRGIRQQGDTIIGVYMQARDIEMPVYLLPRSERMGALRRRCADAMNPLQGDGTFEYLDNDSRGVWQCTVRPFGLPMDTAPNEALAHLEMFHWRGHDPRWYGPRRQILVPMSGAQTTIVNSGTEDVGWTITIDGPCSNPSFQNVTTGEGIAFNLTVDGDHSLQITSVFNQKAANVINKPYLYVPSSVNAYPNRALGSTYWQLPAGVSVVTLTTNPATTASTAARFNYRPAVMGV